MSSSNVDFSVIGIGSSAGGLSALKKFFTNIPSEMDNKAAYVIVHHLSTEHESNLVNLIDKCTNMEVCEVKDGMKINLNSVYIIPPDRFMNLEKGKLHLSKPSYERGMRLPIDFFFRSLAENLKEKSICVLLSGTGTDGTLGLKAIKGEGGMTIVQDPDTTEYDSMPNSAITTGMVDYVLSPDKMPPQLLAYINYVFEIKERSVAPEGTMEESEQVQKIFDLLRQEVGHDFSGYKLNTIRRRLERRMAVMQIKSLEEYVRYVENNIEETKALFKDTLVGVTSFFRDPESFEALKEKVIPKLFEGKEPGEAIRVWVPGCSTGEEAYSIAILIKEELDRRKQHYKVHIFATDIDSDAIEKARQGIYPISIAADISNERIMRYFDRNVEGNTYQINRELRDMLIFAEQNVMDDPPFTKLDLITCRNLLIFLKPKQQEKIFRLFHYALNKNGYLFLGSSESIGEMTDLFESLDQTHKIYKRKGSVSNLYITPGKDATSSKDILKFSRRPSLKKGDEEKGSIKNLVEKTLLRHYTPAAVVINERGDIMYIHGRTGKYLEPAAGQASMNIFKMAREGLKLELMEAVRNVNQQNKPVSYEGLRVVSNGDLSIVNLEVFPVNDSFADLQGMIMIIFKELSSPDVLERLSEKETAVASDLVSEKDKRIVALEQELQDKEEYLQSTIEELETYSEELQSVNEEYQSTNEELETSKEELQSVNEELMTVNKDLQNKIEELRQANNDMNNMLTGTGVGSLFLDESYCIKNFTPAVKEVFNLIEDDIGRPINNITSKLNEYYTLEDDIKYTLDTLKQKEREIQTKDGYWYLMRILPYRTMENVVEGAVINFVDITRQKDMLDSVNRLAVVVRDSSDVITVQDFEGNIQAWNNKAELIYGWSEAEALQMNISNTIPSSRKVETMKMIKNIALNEKIEPYETKRLTKEGNVIDIILTATALVDQEGTPYALATTERCLKIGGDSNGL
ncbi:CheR family methyltransferase [Natranaerofaba carboxydovora]|uniref:CheR family methyltransferase n=1 Tax=Natranaerofaba carboxydovora TaxID=2742683 RepID=UPI001F147B0A|nr:CheR family methyltransferase [Natranaerofaba carboxydovora]UMZ73785.1 Chemotaxis protein methyltransferase [Natranaerofaba carboxydovora]